MTDHYRLKGPFSTRTFPYNIYLISLDLFYHFHILEVEGERNSNLMFDLMFLFYWYIN